MKQKLSLLNTAALSVLMTGVPLIAVSETGTIRPFSFNDVPNHFFAMLPGDSDVSLLVCLTAFDDGYKLVGLGDVFGLEIMFVDAELRADGTMAEIEHSDFVLNGKADLALPLVDTLVQIAAMGLGDVRKADLIFGDQTMFELTDKGSTTVTTLRLGKETYAVYKNPDQVHVVALSAVDETHLRVTAILGTFRAADVKFDLTTPAHLGAADQQLPRERKTVAA